MSHKQSACEASPDFTVTAALTRTDRLRMKTVSGKRTIHKATLCPCLPTPTPTECISTRFILHVVCRFCDACLQEPVSCNWISSSLFPVSRSPRPETYFTDNYSETLKWKPVANQQIWLKVQEVFLMLVLKSRGRFSSLLCGGKWGLLGGRGMHCISSNVFLLEE